MQLLNQTVMQVLVTPTEEYEGRDYFLFALSLSNGEVYRIGSGYPEGIHLVTADEIRTQKWSVTEKFNELLGKQVEGVYGAFGESEPYVHFHDGTVLRVTGDECGDIVVIDSLDDMRQHSEWAIKMWKPISGVN